VRLAGYWRRVSGGFSKVGSMKKDSNSGSTIKIARLLVAAAMIFSAIQSEAFNYQYGDLLIGFRQTGGGTYDVVIDAGPAGNFTNLTTGTKITITALTGQLLNDAFGTTNGLSWSAFGAYDLSYPDESQDGTLFMSRARSSLNTQSTPWGRYSATSQDGTGNKIDGVGVGAFTIGQDLPVNSDNTSNALVELESWNTDGGKASYRSELYGPGSVANWANTFQSVPEQTTSGTFTDDGQPVRADLYWMLPYTSQISHPPGTYLGYFEFNTNGVLTYTAGPSATAPTQPTIVSVTRVGTTTTVHFTTGNGGTYSLLGTNNLTAPKATWPVLGSPVSGNGQTNSISDVTTDGSRFYLIRAQ
jgi:hypothetical protein